MRLTEHSLPTLGWRVFGVWWKEFWEVGPFTRLGWIALLAATLLGFVLLGWGLAVGGEAWRAWVWRGEYAQYELDGVWGKHLFDCNYVAAVNPHFPPRTRSIWLKYADDCWRHDFADDYAAAHRAK